MRRPSASRSESEPVRIDLRAQLKHLYAPTAYEVQVVDVPSMSFLMVDGVGAPEGDGFRSAIQTLYNLAYTIKFGMKKAGLAQFPVMALEGLWASGDSPEGFDAAARDGWRWTLMIVQPEVVTPRVVSAAAEEVRGKGKPLGEFRFESFHEGLSAQLLHIGPYSAEAPTIERVRDFMRQRGYSPNGRHHEIYLGDPRRAAPSKLRTILRRPIRPS
ncbi:MAG: GyrI-like domain-containing protein [Nitrososphaerales archaeon]|jgi:hypothetical protein